MYKLIDGLLFKRHRCTMIPVHSLNEQQKDGCVICMRNFTNNKPSTRSFVKRLKCSHVYHSECLNQWLNKEITCPLCRTSLYYPVENQDLLDCQPYRKYLLVPVTSNQWNIEIE